MVLGDSSVLAFAVKLVTDACELLFAVVLVVAAAAVPMRIKKRFAEVVECDFVVE